MKYFLFLPFGGLLTVAVGILFGWMLVWGFEPLTRILKRRSDRACLFIGICLPLIATAVALPAFIAFNQVWRQINPPKGPSLGLLPDIVLIVVGASAFSVTVVLVTLIFLGRRWPRAMSIASIAIVAAVWCYVDFVSGLLFAAVSFVTLNSPTPDPLKVAADSLLPNDKGLMVSTRTFRPAILIFSACIGGPSLVGAGIFAVGGAGIYGSPLAGSTHYNATLLLVLLCGPVAILPCTIVEKWKPNWGAMSLCSLAIVEICVLILNNTREWGFARGDAAVGSVYLAAPMFLIGSSFLFSSPRKSKTFVLCWQIQLVIVALFAIGLGRPFSLATAHLLWFYIILRFLVANAKSVMNDDSTFYKWIFESPTKEDEPQETADRGRQDDPFPRKHQLTPTVKTNEKTSDAGSQTLTWFRAALLAVGWSILLVLVVAILIFLHIEFYKRPPRPVATWIIVLGVPLVTLIAAGLTHRSWKVPLFIAALIGIGLCVWIVFGLLVSAFVSPL